MYQTEPEYWFPTHMNLQINPFRKTKNDQSEAREPSGKGVTQTGQVLHSQRPPFQKEKCHQFFSKEEKLPTTETYILCPKEKLNTQRLHKYRNSGWWNPKREENNKPQNHKKK